MKMQLLHIYHTTYVSFFLMMAIASMGNYIYYMYAVLNYTHAYSMYNCTTIVGLQQISSHSIFFSKSSDFL